MIMGEMSDYYLSQEDPFDDEDNYWRGKADVEDEPDRVEQDRGALADQRRNVYRGYRNG